MLGRHALVLSFRSNFSSSVVNKDAKLAYIKEMNLTAVTQPLKLQDILGESAIQTNHWFKS